MIQENIAGYLKLYGGGGGRAVAAGTGDATEVVGAKIDRQGFASANLAIAYAAHMTSTKTLSFAVTIDDSDDNSTFGTPVVIQASTLAQTYVAAVDYGVVDLTINLAGYKRYVRANITPDLSNTATDTLEWAATWILGGASAVPA